MYIILSFSVRLCGKMCKQTTYPDHANLKYKLQYSQSMFTITFYATIVIQ